MVVLYGSNSGTCEVLAQSLARVAGARGFRARVDTLDSAIGKVSKGEPVVMISSSYEGKLPDNAANFVNWLSNLEDEKRLEGSNMQYMSAETVCTSLLYSRLFIADMP